MELRCCSWGKKKMERKRRLTCRRRRWATEGNDEVGANVGEQQKEVARGGGAKEIERTLGF